MENNNLPLVLTRISLGITLLYVGVLFVLSTPSSSDRSVGDGIGMMMVFLFPHLVTLIIATILNIIISFERNINRTLIVITLILYITSGLLGTSFIPIFGDMTVPAITIQVILLLIASITFKKIEKTASIAKIINKRSFTKKNIKLPLILSRVSLGIALIYLCLLFVIYTPLRSGSSVIDRIDILISFLSSQLIAFAIAVILNIIISIEEKINQQLIILTLVMYIITGILSPIFIPFLAILSIIQVIPLIFACISFNNKDNIVKNEVEKKLKTKKNTTPLVFTRITLGITLLYIGWLFNMFESFSFNSSAGSRSGIIVLYLYPYLAAVLIIAAIFNIIISFKENINEPLIIITIIIYVFAGILGALFFTFIVIIAIIQVILLVFALSTFKNKDD